MMYTDPSGEAFLPIFFAIAGAFVGGAAANDWNFNPFKWKWNFSTLGSMLLGGITGALAGQSVVGFVKGATPLSIGVNANNVISSFANFTLKGGKFLLKGAGYLTAAGGGVYMTKSAIDNSNRSKDNLNRTREYLDIPTFENGKNLSSGNKYARELQSYYENGQGVDYVISKERLFDIYNKALYSNSFNWNKARYLGDYI